MAPRMKASRSAIRADDGTEGDLLGDSTTADAFEFEGRDAELVAHYEFLSTVGQLWRVAATCRELSSNSLRRWEETASKWEGAIDEVLDRLHQAPVPNPPPGLESAIEYDRRRGMKEHLIDRASFGVARNPAGAAQPARALPGVRYAAQSWEVQALGIETRSRPAMLRPFAKLCPDSSRSFARSRCSTRRYPSAAHRSKFSCARTAQSLLIEWMKRLPRLGLLRETYLLIQTARAMEENSRGGRRITEFDRLFPVAVRRRSMPSSISPPASAPPSTRTQRSTRAPGGSVFRALGRATARRCVFRSSKPSRARSNGNGSEGSFSGTATTCSRRRFCKSRQLAVDAAPRRVGLAR